MKSDNLIDRLNAILDCYDDRNVNNEEIRLLLNILGDDRVIGGRRLSSYAIAALYLNGQNPPKMDEEAKRLISELT